MENGYQNMLREELLGRVKKNPSYSARAMARDVGMSPSYFCQVLNRTRFLTESRAFELADKLSWDPEKCRRFVTLLRYEKASDEGTRKKILSEMKQASTSRLPLYGMDSAYFETMSSWVHYAILELTGLKEFQPKAKWIAQKLGQPVVEVEMAIRRLRTLGMLITEDGKWKKAHFSYSTPDDELSCANALRRFHSGVLKLSGEKLWEEQSQREFGSIVVATDPKKMAQFKEKLRNFQNEMMALMEEGEPKAVYQMSVQFFRLDKEVHP